MHEGSFWLVVALQKTHRCIKIQGLSLSSGCPLYGVLPVSPLCMLVSWDCILCEHYWVWFSTIIVLYSVCFGFRLHFKMMSSLKSCMKMYNKCAHEDQLFIIRFFRLDNRSYDITGEPAALWSETGEWRETERWGHMVCLWGERGVRGKSVFSARDDRVNTSGAHKFRPPAHSHTLPTCSHSILPKDLCSGNGSRLKK